jgi:hypothetical protein
MVYTERIKTGMVSGKVLARKLARKRSSGRPGSRWKGNFKTGLK